MEPGKSMRVSENMLRAEGGEESSDRSRMVNLEFGAICLLGAFTDFIKRVWKAEKRLI